MPRVQHNVLLKVKEDVRQEDVDLFFRTLVALKGKIDGILSVSYGPYSSPEGFNKGYTHGFSMVFADEQSRDIYLTHPAHDEVKDLLPPILLNGFDGAVAFDYLLTDSNQF